MANCHNLFLKYTDAIALQPTKKKSLRTSRDAVRDKIRDYFKAKNNGLTPKFHGQGSFMMNSIITPLDGEFDIDDGIYFLVEEEPTIAIATFHQWVINAVDGHTDTPPVDKTTCVRLIYKKNYHLDLPIYYFIDGSCPKLAHKSKGWIDSDPREFIKWFDTQADQNGQMKRIVRYLKGWKDFRAGTLPSGLVLSILAANHISLNERDDIALLDTLRNIRDELEDNFVCYRPTTPTDEDLLQNFSQTNKDYFMGQLDGLIAAGETAIEKTNQKEACSCWQKHFGERFPCHLAKDSLLRDASQSPYTFPNKPVFPVNKPRGFA